MSDQRAFQERQTDFGTEKIPEWLELVRLQVESLQFGTLQITVHDTKVVQLERIEKTRFAPRQSSNR